MFYFSYNDFVDFTQNTKYFKQKSKEKRKLNKQLLKVEDEKSTYYLKNNMLDNKSIIVESLKNKKELIKFLRKFFQYNISEKEEIELCKNKIVKSDKNDFENITYKIKSQEKYIFIKVVSEIDSNISYKIFEHSLKIINEWDERKSKSKRKPIVIPIVIYIGCNEWNSYGIVNHNSTKCKANIKIKYIKHKGNRINFAYNLIRITDFEKGL